MRKIIFFNTICVLVMSLCLIGCSQDDSMWGVSSSNEEEMLNTIYSKYIILENDQYRLNLSREEALELGISENCYAKVLTNIESTNAFVVKGIEHAKRDPNMVVVLSNPSGSDYEIQFLNSERIITYHDNLEINSIRLKNGGESEASWRYVETKNLTLGCATSSPTGSGTVQGATKVKFTFKGEKNVVGTLTLTVNSIVYQMTSYKAALTKEEINVSGSVNWSVQLTNGTSGQVKVYKISS
jgi:hypothetical protein